MDFHDFPTIYSTLKHRKLVEASPDRFYRENLLMLRMVAHRRPSHALALENNRGVCEWDWLRLGSPYFKVWPGMIPLLSEVNIDVPVDYLRLPFKAFAVRLPLEENPLVIDQHYSVRAILVSEGEPADAKGRRIHLWIDIGERRKRSSARSRSPL